MNGINEIIFEEIPGKDGTIGLITLNRPQVLNSLNHSMIQLLQKNLDKWSEAKFIKAVVIQAAAGKAFCAGGDLSFIYQQWLKQDGKVTDFFRDEYHLNRTIFHYPKPYIALLDGITMGGGVGISFHGSHRIATENFLFAMPETAIGFYPDVGGTYFLPRLAGYFGVYLGLTGARLKADECSHLGLVEKVEKKNLADFFKRLLEEKFDSNPKEKISEIIYQYKKPLETSTLLAQQHDIDSCFSHDNVEQINQALLSSNNELCKKAAAILKTKSPTSLKVTLRALLQGKYLDFDQCMEREYDLTAHFLAGHDFAEGVRALIIDKDQQPKWDPSTLDLVTPDIVEEYFVTVHRVMFE